MSGIKRIKHLLNTRSILNPLTLCILEALHLCLECNNSVFNNKFYLETDATMQGTHMSCSYSDIAMAVYDEKAMDHPIKPWIWKRFRDDVIALRIPISKDANYYFHYLNTMMPQVRVDLQWKLKLKMVLSF